MRCLLLEETHTIGELEMKYHSVAQVPFKLDQRVPISYFPGLKIASPISISGCQKKIMRRMVISASSQGINGKGLHLRYFRSGRYKSRTSSVPPRIRYVLNFQYLFALHLLGQKADRRENETTQCGARRSGDNKKSKQNNIIKPPNQRVYS